MIYQQGQWELGVVENWEGGGCKTEASWPHSAAGPSGHDHRFKLSAVHGISHPTAPALNFIYCVLELAVLVPQALSGIHSVAQLLQPLDENCRQLLKLRAWWFRRLKAALTMQHSFKVLNGISKLPGLYIANSWWHFNQWLHDTPWVRL